MTVGAVLSVAHGRVFRAAGPGSYLGYLAERKHHE
jgi:hypothetical protein